MITVRHFMIEIWYSHSLVLIHLQQKKSMNIKKWTENGWAKDQILTGCIMDSLDSTKGQDYVYCISVQGHGDYPTTQIIENPEITVEGIEDEALKNKLYFIMSIRFIRWINLSGNWSKY